MFKKIKNGVKIPEHTLTSVSLYQFRKVSKKLNKKEGKYKITPRGENETMEQNKNNRIRWLGLRLTKKRAVYLTVLSSIGSSFFAVAIFFAVPVLYYARTNIFPYDKLLYAYTLLLSLSNFLASIICIGIFSYALSKVRKFRKSLKNQ